MSRQVAHTPAVRDAGSIEEFERWASVARLAFTGNRGAGLPHAWEGRRDTGVTVRYKDYRRDGADRHRVMTLDADGFIRRLLLHVLPRGLHRIRHYGPLDVRPPCPCWGARMIIIETFERRRHPRALSIFVWRSRICTARRLPVCLWIMDALVRRGECIP